MLRSLRRSSLPLVALAAGGSLLPAQDAAEAARVRKVWNEVFQRIQALGEEWRPNEFLARAVAGRHPGRALDVGMGQGRNSLFLADLGWDVTGFDISDEAVAQTRAQAEELGLELEAKRGDVYEFDYGVERWDLIVGMYMHELFSDQAEKLVGALKPGGLLVVEGFHRDLNQESVQGGYFGFASNELLEDFEDLRILHYSDQTDRTDWGRTTDSGHPVVRLLARKPWPVLADRRGPWLGEGEAGDSPAVFAVGVVDTEAFELNAVMAPGGREFLFTRRVDGELTMHRSLVENGHWTWPMPLDLLPPGTTGPSVDMAYSADGRELWFVGPGPGLDLWRSTRTGDAWSTAERVGAPVSTEAQELYPSLTADGSVYFVSNREGGPGRTDLWRAQRRPDGSFAAPVPFPAPINSPHREGDAFVTRDESILVFASDRPGGQGNYDLWVSFRDDPSASWSQPRNLGPTINTDQNEYCPVLSEDGETLLFSRRDTRPWNETEHGSIHRVRATLLQRLRD